jgi:hypothetical protein
LRGEHTFRQLLNESQTRKAETLCNWYPLSRYCPGMSWHIWALFDPRLGDVSSNGPWDVFADVRNPGDPRCAKIWTKISQNSQCKALSVLIVHLCRCL